MFTGIKKTALAAIAVASTSTAFAAAAHAERSNDPAFLAEVDSCVAELTRRLDVTDASRVRHVVTDYKRSALGYALKIQTSVYSPALQSKYSVYCVANGNNVPIKFRWKALDV